MAVEAVVSVVLQKLTEMLKGQSLTQNKYISNEVQEIMKSLNSVRDLMISTKEINHQAEEYLDAVYNVEDRIEKFTLIVVHQRKVFGFLTNHIFFFNNLSSCQKIHHKIKKITTQLMQLKVHKPYGKLHIEEIPTEEEKDEETVVGNHKTIEGSSSTSEMQATNPGSYMEELNFSYSCNEEQMQIVGIKERFQKMSSFSYKEEELGIFGLKEDVEILVKQLTKNSEDFVSIVGQGGIGKTTLARTIYKNRNIKCHFQFHAWVSVLREYTTEDIMLSLLKGTDIMTDKATNLDDEKAMKLKLSDYLKSKRLLRLWLAEGFVKQNSTNVFPEDIAQTYFDELVSRNMIQISKLRSDNSPRRCHVLGVLHDYLLPKAQETNLFYTYRDLIRYEEVGSLNVRRMVEYESPKRETRNQFGIEMSKKTQLKSSPFNPSHLRSYMSFNHQKTDYRQAKRIGSFLGNIINDGIGLLRVLDLEGVYKPILPENLGNLCNLRYLGLRSTYLDSLPSSIGELTHLETLDVKHTCIDELPGSIWRLKNLQHLNLNDTCLDMQPQSSLRLLTLWGLFLDEKIAIKNGLDKLHDLRELGITFQLKSNQDDLMDWIANLSALRSLKLRSKDNLGGASKHVFRSMSNLEQLSRLNLLGNLEKLPDENQFPPTLKVLTLSISLLKQDPMQTLGQLPCLTVLRLLGQSYIGKEMVCRKGGFSKLRLLKMWKLKELENWFVEEGSMENLKHLDIRCCDRLSNIPTTLLQQQKLEKLVLTGMPHRFTTEVERLKLDHTSMTVDHWKFPPLPCEIVSSQTDYVKPYHEKPLKMSLSANVFS
ncbi:Disease resistance protein, partial [Cynara cardunculus var. scolymus]